MSRKTSFGLKYGVKEDLVCLGPANIPVGNASISGCYAAKVKTYWLILPARKYVDEYVIASGDTYYALKSGGISLLQKQGLLPAKAPEYKISNIETAWGHSLGILLGILLLTSLAYKALPRRAQKHISSLTKSHNTSDQELVKTLSNKYLSTAEGCACNPSGIIVVDHSHSTPVRGVEMEKLANELSVPGFPEEEISRSKLIEVYNLKSECYRAMVAEGTRSDSSPYINAVIIMRAGQAPLVRKIISGRKPTGT